MSFSFIPELASPGSPQPTEPLAVVPAFLAAIAAADSVTMSALLDDDVTYINVGMPALRGRQKTLKALGGMARLGMSFEVYLHSMSGDGIAVLTERTDAIVLGPLRIQFWVAGRFDVENGRITLWRDYFDYVDVVRATLRGLLGVAVPALRPKRPSEPQTSPGGRSLPRTTRSASAG